MRNNPGVKIKTPPASEVKVVSDGTVFAVQPMPNYGNVVFVKHGDYYTAYGNLSEINVEEGSTIEAGTNIGKSGTEDSEMGEGLFFMMRKNKENINPQEWFKK